MSLRSLPVLDPSILPRVPAVPRLPGPLPPGMAEFATDDLVQPRFHIWTLGCQMNRSDSEEMAGTLLAAGCREAGSLEDADLVVINTCSIRQAAEHKVVARQGQLAMLKRLNPGLRVVLTGCAVRADNAASLARRYPAVDLFLRPDEEPELAERLGLAGPTGPGVLAGGGPLPEVLARVGRGVSATADRLPGTRADAVAQGHVARGSLTHAWIPVIYGCDKTCTYCIVPFSRGPERSRPFDDIVAEARRLAEAGYQDVTLLGQNVNSYGHDLPREGRFAGVRWSRRFGHRLDLDGRPDIAALLRAIDAIRAADGRPAIPRLRFITSHPWDLSERLIAALAECPSVCEHLHLPVQSGSDEVLRRMGRQYTVASYRELVARLRAAVPGIALTTDVIAGFCGETEAQFQATLELLREVRFDQVFAAAYSPRPGTPASRLADDVPPAEKRRRLNLLLGLQEEIGWERNRAWLGRATEVLVERVRPARSHEHAASGDPERAGAGGPFGQAASPSEADRLAGGTHRLVGRNRENKLVHLDGPPDLVGRRVPVRIEHAGPYALAGRLAGARGAPVSARALDAPASGAVASGSS